MGGQHEWKINHSNMSDLGSVYLTPQSIGGHPTRTHTSKTTTRPFSPLATKVCNENCQKPCQGIEPWIDMTRHEPNTRARAEVCTRQKRERGEQEGRLKDMRYPYSLKELMPPCHQCHGVHGPSSESMSLSSPCSFKCIVNWTRAGALRNRLIGGSPSEHQANTINHSRTQSNDTALTSVVVIQCMDQATRSLRSGIRPCKTNSGSLHHELANSVTTYRTHRRIDHLRHPARCLHVR